VILERLERLGVKLHVCNLMGGAIDLSSPMGRFMIHILAAFAELERAFISERTRDGMAKRKREHRPVSPYAGYGFTWEKRWIDGKRVKVRVECPEERKAMKSIALWKLQGKTWDEIRQHLVYNLKLKTKEGKPWDDNRIRRAYRAELMLQLREQRPGRQITKAGDNT
jgi:DNA invertase Pin-like site-specific DNA recombinase